MKPRTAILLIGGLIAAAVSAQTYDPLPGPSPYGPDDEAGASNTQTAERVRDAGLGTNGYYLVNGDLGEPGLGLPAAQWLTDRGVVCVGADNWGLDVAPPPPPPAPGVLFAVHHHLLVKSGVFMQESMALAELAADLAADFQKTPSPNVYEFLYIFNPVPIQGASGSLGAPIAIR